MFKNIVFILFAFIKFGNARPNIEIGPQNVVTVPPNCPTGQEWVNGECRDIWKHSILPSNLVTVPPNCPAGQEYVNGQCRDVWIKTNSGQSRNDQPILNFEQKNVVTVPNNCKPSQQWVNGVCRDVWRSDAIMPANVVTVPPNCPVGQEYVNGQCRDVWIKNDQPLLNFEQKNVVTVPNNCKPSQQWVNGVCRDVWRSDAIMPVNVITVPPNCPVGQEYVNGQCRDVWIKYGNPVEIIKKYVNDLKTILSSNTQVENKDALREDDSENKNVISVPNQCPAGYKPDALGICREIFG